MIDDGKHDPPEIKIEDLPWSIAQFDLWEHELQTPPPKLSKPRRKRLSFWGLIEALGRTYIHGGY